MNSLSSRATAGRAQVSWMKRHSLLKPHHGGTIGRTRHALMEWWSIFASFHVRTELWQLHAKAQLRVDANCGSSTQSHRGGDQAVHCFVGFCSEIHATGASFLGLGSSVPPGTPFLPRILLSKGFGSSIFFGANPSDSPVEPS